MSISVRKLKLTIINEDSELRKQQYQFLRDSQYAQYQALNKAMGYLMTGYLTHGINTEEFKEWKKNLKNSNPIFSDIQCGRGIDTLSAVTQKAKKDFEASLRNGMLKGERSCTNYKRTFPLMTRGRDLKFYEQDGDVFIKWVNKITFKVIFNKRKENTLELQHTLQKVLNREYKIAQSSLEFDRNNNLILNLSMDIPFVQQEEFIKGRVLGVDLGINVPCYMSLNDKIYVRKALGNINDFLRVRQQMQERRRELQKALVLTKGGKGRNKKLQALNRLKEKEANFVKTYNHTLSKRVVDFAKQNKVEEIHLEKLTSEGLGNTILRNWSFYQLQQDIEYKAKRVGIKVVYVDPQYTSQMCSKCGHIAKENRPKETKGQEYFKCTKCGNEMNADHNASINIARLKEGESLKTKYEEQKRLEEEFFKSKLIESVDTI